LSTFGHSALSALFPDGHSALSASDLIRISMQACASCVVLARTYPVGCRRRGGLREEEFFNHYKNDLRHAHTPSGVAGADLSTPSALSRGADTGL